MRAVLFSLFLTACSLQTARAACGCRSDDQGFAASCVPRGSCASSSCLGPLNSDGVCTNWVAPTTCSSGFYNSGAGSACTGSGSSLSCSLGTCLPCDCGKGATVSFCDSVYTTNALPGQTNLVCSACTQPSNSVYVTNNTCDFQCNAGFSGPSCTPCVTSCPVAGTQLTGSCTQTLNGLADDVPACTACGLSNVATYSSGCTIATCINGYHPVANQCVDDSPPPSPFPPPPSPPKPPSPPSPPPSATSTIPECADSISGHWFGTTPPLTPDGLVADSVAGLNAEFVGTYSLSGSTVVFNSNGYAETQTTITPTTNSISIRSTFKKFEDTSMTVWQFTDSLTTPANYVSLWSNSNSTLTVAFHTTAFGANFFTSSSTCVANQTCTTVVTCTKYLQSCYIS